MLNSGVCMVPRRSASALLQSARSELGWLYCASFPRSLALYFYCAGRGSLSLVAMLHWIGNNHKQTFSPAKVTWQGLQHGWLRKGSQQRILRSDWLNEWDTDRDFPLKILVEFLWRNLFSVFPEQPSKQRFWKRTWITALDLAAESTNWKS